MIINVISTTNDQYFYTDINELLENSENTLLSPNIHFGGEDLNNDTIPDVISGKVSFVGNSSNIKTVDIFFFVGAKLNVFFFICKEKIKNI